MGRTLIPDSPQWLGLDFGPVQKRLVAALAHYGNKITVISLNGLLFRSHSEQRKSNPLLLPPPQGIKPTARANIDPGGFSVGVDLAGLRYSSSLFDVSSSSIISALSLANCCSRAASSARSLASRLSPSAAFVIVSWLYKLASARL